MLCRQKRHGAGKYGSHTVTGLFCTMIIVCKQNDVIPCPADPELPARITEGGFREIFLPKAAFFVFRKKELILIDDGCPAVLNNPPAEQQSEETEYLPEHIPCGQASGKQPVNAYLRLSPNAKHARFLCFCLCPGGKRRESPAPLYHVRRNRGGKAHGLFHPFSVGKRCA